MAVARHRGALALLAALSAAVGPAARAQSPSTIFIVRHAEKGPGSPDPSLSKEGADRAKALARVLRDGKIAAIYVTEFKRTRETAAPLAQELGIEPSVLSGRDLDRLVTQLKELPAGTRALVVSHSNLVPVIVERLAGETIGELTEDDYDRLYAVTLAPGGASVVYLHYGGPSPVGSGGPMRP